MIVIPGEQRTDEWRQARCGVATASNFAAVMAGDSTAARRNYIVRLAIERLTNIPQERDFTPTRDMQNGTDREPLLVMNYEMATGNDVQQVAFVRHDSMPYGASPDGLVQPRGGIEGKCPNQATHLSYLQRDTIPTEYQWQVHGLILLADLQWCDFVSYHPDFPEDLQLHVIRQWRDEYRLNQLRAGLSRFLAEVNVTVQEIKALGDARKLQRLAA